ncbi:hypothetical protein M2283_008442 [Streptomyces pseudovenezuelae]|uniref:Uncharacterized protein n=1 Tax=Streptomyces pseudovenezuelae TaxID=67350 RepID=A0ABT6LXU1_9ACTN|nr:hypothetical protein [Streptomyces pseudovenezuelae]
MGADAEPVEDMRGSISDPLTDRRQRGSPCQHGTGGERKYDGQRVAHPARVTRVRHLAQPFQQVRDFLQCNLGLMAELVKSRRDRG